MKFLGVIPARYGSTRFEGKPLADIHGHPMIEWVYKKSKLANLDEVIVATDDSRIYDAVVNFGGKVEMTSTNHNTGTDRIAEIAEKYGDYDVIINIQGDEPIIEKEMINSLIDAFKNENELKMATLKHKIIDFNNVKNENFVKVICDKNDYAIYFSRSVIPFPRHLDIDNYYKHIGIYAYNRKFLLEYAKMEQTPLEKSESLEQLRALENGYKIKVLETNCEIHGVDTREDLEKVKQIIVDRNIKIDK
jgi:3-deoxy-manno-octulosonate cytidylyltransferase (CMP-KDO synthetase)